MAEGQLGWDCHLEHRHVSCHVMCTFHCLRVILKKSTMGTESVRRKPFENIVLTFLHREEESQPAQLHGRGQRLFHSGISCRGLGGCQCFQLSIGKDFRVSYGAGATVWILSVRQICMC